MLIADIDCFKGGNDRYGHQSSDEYLKKVAGVLKESVSRVDYLAARYWGEEFALVLEDTDTNGVRSVIERIIQKGIDLKLENTDSNVCPFLTVSFGISVEHPDPEMEIDTASIVQKADTALYETKSTGQKITVIK